MYFIYFMFFYSKFTYHGNTFSIELDFLYLNSRDLAFYLLIKLLLCKMKHRH